jgi:hypothetical protein
MQYALEFSNYLEGEIQVTLRLTVGRSFSRSVSQSVSLGIEHSYGTCDQILLRVGMFLSEIYSVVTQWSELRRTCNHSLLSHLRLSQPGGPGSRIYIPQEQGGPVIPPGSGLAII